MSLTRISVLILCCLLAFTLFFCDTESTSDHQGEGEYLNLNDSVAYVGMQTCRSCHENVYKTYIHTGMGQSFDIATKEKSAAVYDEHALVYDPETDFYYRPAWKDSVLYITEFRLENGDTVHQRSEKISYVIGSGQHTNSHLINQNGYVYQAPITFYTQDGKWDMAPGFEGGANSRFSRMIATECMTCHNHLPKQIVGAENKYLEVPTGIECERCHGPGALHVQEKLSGNIVDTSKFVDYTIVNPADLPTALEVDLCQRCHLQGTTVLNEGKTFYDFKPGMPLNAVMNVFLPRYSNNHEKFIMASQADRMQLSACFKVGEMRCTDCHNPHVSVKSTAKKVYNNACKNCHNSPPTFECSAPIADRKAKEDDCATCHMPKTGSIDIPHVRITDHFIRKPIEKEEKEAIARFIGLECLTQENPSDLLMAQGYLALYDKFVPEIGMLDSAAFYLEKMKTDGGEKLDTEVHYFFTRQDYNSIINAARNNPAATISDGWTAYRIGEAYLSLGDVARAEQYFVRAVALRPYNLDFNNKLGAAYLQQQKVKEAKAVFDFMINENDRLPIAINNRGFIYLIEGNPEKAKQFYDKALQLDPDYERAYLNKIGYFIFVKDFQQAKAQLKQFMKKFPDNERAPQILKSLS